MSRAQAGEGEGKGEIWEVVFEVRPEGSHQKWEPRLFEAWAIDKFDAWLDAAMQAQAEGFITRAGFFTVETKGQETPAP